MLQDKKLILSLLCTNYSGYQCHFGFVNVLKYARTKKKGNSWKVEEEALFNQQYYLY